MSTKVAVVTGSNKGVGFGIVRGLCKRFDGAVYLTSRDVERGRKAVEDLKKEGLNPKYHQLDITDKQSLETFRDYIKENYGGIDVLVNNAAIAFKGNATEPVPVQAEQTLFVNYFSLVLTCDILFPLLRNGARVVNVSSSAGHLTKIPSEELRRKFKNPSLTVPELSALMQKYIRHAQNGIIVNAVHPGYVDTDMTSHRGELTIEQGAAAPLFAALDIPQSYPGQYVWCNKNIIDWEGGQ